MELLSFYNLQEVLEQYGEALRNAYQDNLISDDKIASGELLNSVDFLVLTGNNEIWVEFHLEDYYKYIEYGTKPHWPPLNKIMEWIRVKPVLPNNNTGKLPTVEQLAFLIGRKISEDGIEPGKQFQNAQESLKAEWEAKIEEAITKDINESVDFILLKYFK